MAAYNIKAALRAAKNIQYEPIEVKVREATNNDPWGVSTSAMSDIARSTHHHDEYALLFKMVWKRLNDHEHVMHVQKALILIDYLLRNGAERFITDAKRRARDVSALQKYKQYDANNRDVGGDVRAKAKAVYELLTNEAKLSEERAKAKSIRDVKLSGMSSDGFGSGRSSHANAREFDEDRYNAESPRHNDWERDASPSPVAAKPRSKPAPQTQEDEEEEAEEKEQPAASEESKKKKKKSKSAEGETTEDGKKKKKKKKKSAAESGTDTTAPPSAEATAPGTPSFGGAAPAPTHNEFGSFDAFGSSNDFGSVTSSAGASPVAPVATISMAAPIAADKPKKSRKKKDSTIVASEPVEQQSNASSVNANGDFDLSNFASVPTGGDVDILTGTTVSAPLEDMFAQSSLMDGPMDGPAEEDGFLVDEPALLDQPHYDAHPNPHENGVTSPKSPANKDVWDLASNFTNIDNIQSNAPAKPKPVNPQETVSMSMMRSMQPFGSSSGSTPSKPAQPSGFGSFGAPAGGMPNGFPAQQSFGGFGMPQQPMQPGFGGPQAGFGAPQAFGQPAFGAASQHPFGMSAFGAPAGFGAPSMESDLPFAAQSINQKRPGANGKPVIFDVQQARPQVVQQPTSNAPTGPRWR